MENKEIEQTNKPQQGTWDNISNMEQPKLKFEKFDSPEIVTMDCDRPREIMWDESVFYVFDVIHQGINKQLSTSAWSMLKGIKSFEPIKGKSLKITKKMVRGKQQYWVEDVEEEVIS